MLETRRQKLLLHVALYSNLVLSCALLLDTLFLLSTPDVGFGAVVTAAIYVVFTLVALSILSKTPSAFSIGFLVGASSLVLVMALQGALYWGLEARSNPQQTAASWLASGIHAVIFTVQLIATSVVVKSKEDFIDTYAAYEYIPDATYADNTVLANILHTTSPPYYRAAIPTADI
uniref:Uncharacterized protein n=1 Tax=Peronospora matthiolae TaxID=2874970 RepID=A0AAV1T1J4_9STRA